MRTGVAVGLVAVVFGFTVVLQRGLAAPFGSMTYTFVMLVGALALVQGLRYASEARTVEARATATPDVEDRYEVPVPGSDVDQLLASAGGLSTGSVGRRRELHERLRAVTRETLLSRGDYAEAGAADALADGTWTGDPVAAWFVGTDVPPPPSVRIRGLLGSDVEFTFAARRTVSALAAVRAGEEDPLEGGAAEPRGFVGAARGVGRRRFRALRDRFRGVSR